MKRYIQSDATYNDYPVIFNNSADTESIVNESDMELQIRDICRPAAEFISKVEVNLGTMSVHDIRVYSNLRVSQLRVTSTSKNTNRAFVALLQKITEALPDWISRNRSKQQARVHGHGEPLIAARVTQKLIDSRFNFYSTCYPDTGKVVYYGWQFAGGLFKYTPEEYFERANTNRSKLQREIEHYVQQIAQEYDMNLSLDFGASGFVVRARPQDNGYYYYDSELDDYVKAT